MTLCARPFVAMLGLLAGLMAAGWPAWAQEPATRFFRIGTGASSETHFAAGGLIANIVSKPPGSRPCDKGGSCGVPGLIAVAQTTGGSVANIEGLADGRIEAALVQADIAFAAFKGVGTFKGRPPFESLRGLAMLYPETLHVVVRRDSGITAIEQLKGKRVSLGAEGSGTLADARTVLQVYGVREKDLKAEFLRTGAAATKLAQGQIDAFFAIDATPVPAIVDLARDVPLRILPISGMPAEKLRRQFPFFVPTVVEREAYVGLDEPVPTLDVPLVLVVDAKLDEELAFGLTRALWQPSSRQLLTQASPRGGKLLLDHPAEQMGVPLHNGASAFYFENGLIE